MLTKGLFSSKNIKPIEKEEESDEEKTESEEKTSEVSIF